jgi:hypothetical protein
MRLPSLENDLNIFSKFTKQFWSNENHFSVDYYFRSYQTQKNTKIILRQNKRSINRKRLKFHANAADKNELSKASSF